MGFEDVLIYVFLFLMLFGGSTAGFIQHLQSRRHRFKLDMAKEKTRQAQSQAKLIEAQNRRTALDVRKAELEIERYDQRIPGRPPTPSLPISSEHDAGEDVR